MIITEAKPKSPQAERFKILRTNISFSSFDEEIQTILVTSASPGEGKSTVASNLAVTFAQDGKNVLLVDADLRKASIHKKFNTTNRHGLTEVISKKINFSKAYQQHYNNLHILTSGIVPPNPSEMLSSHAMEKFLADMKTVYDVIVIDAPPVNAVTDPQILSTLVDGTLFVVRANKTKRDEIVHAKRLLDKVDAKIIGSVLNDVNTKSSHYYYYYGDSE